MNKLKTAIIYQLKNRNNVIALLGKDRVITYAELDYLSDKIASHVSGLAFNKPIQHLGIYLEDTVMSVVCMIAAIKMNIAYVPLDYSYPLKRIEYMLEAAKVDILITDKQFNSYSCIQIEDILKENEFDNSTYIEQTGERVYILFTSGSTGTPKAVALTLSGIENLLSFYISNFNINHTDVFLSVTSLSFDLTQKNILSALMTGARIYLISPQDLISREAVKIITKYSVSLINCTPSIFYALLDATEGIGELLSIRYILLGGEKIKTHRLIKLLSIYDNTRIVNTYGPTECSDLLCTYTLTRQDLENKNEPPIGKKLPNIDLHIVDDTFNLVPNGTPGKLYVSGVAVSEGYINDSNYTAKKFIYKKLNNTWLRLYDVGDWVKENEDGTLQFLSRIDDQIKLRGQRIELGEIENILQQFYAIKEAALIILQHTSEHQELAAFIILDKSYKETKELKEEIYNHMAQFLPQYMLPNQLIFLSKFPLNANGKLDKNKLKELNPVNEKHKIIDEKNEIIEKIKKLFKEVLKVSDDQVFSSSNFFELGGYSLPAFELLNQLKTIFHKNFNFLDLIKNPSPEEIFHLMAKKETHYSVNEIPEFTETTFPLSTAQKRAISNFEHEKELYATLPVAYKIKGKLDVLHLKNCIIRLMTKHEALRTTFIRSSDEIFQKIIDVSLINAPLKILDFTQAILSNTCTVQEEYIDKAFLLSTSQTLLSETSLLFKIIVAKISKEEYIVLFNFNHAIIDGTAWSLLKYELSVLYNQENFLDYNNYQYKNYVSYDKQKERNQEIQDFEEFLKETKVRISKKNDSGKYRYVKLCFFELPNFYLEKLKARFNIGSQLFSFLYLAFYLALQEFDAQDLNIRTAVSDRLPIFSDTIGMMINALPCKLFETHGKNCSALFQETTEYFDRLFGFSNFSIEEVTGNSYAPDILMVYQNSDKHLLHFKGLEIQRYNIKEKIGVFALEFHIWPLGKTGEVEIAFDPLRFPTDFAQHLFERFLFHSNKMYQEI